MVTNDDLVAAIPVMIAILMDNHGLVARFTVSHDHIAIPIVVAIAA